jgi:hypothetical protein
MEVRALELAAENGHVDVVSLLLSWMNTRRVYYESYKVSTNIPFLVHCCIMMNDAIISTIGL